MAEVMLFPNTIDEFLDSYSFKDSEGIYTNGSELISVFRVKQALAHFYSDVVEVVRCKDCSKKDYCRTSNVWAISPSDDWFCADGERRE